jgi:UDP-2-acetamido-2,6-beta-L-arabino-hexul-4-ose reductase
VLCDLAAHGRRTKVVLSSSIQAALDNPYGRSKRAAEELLRLHCDSTGAEGVVYRLKNLFGKWCRPNYNSVVATFANAIANDLPFHVSDPGKMLDLTYVDDVVAAFIRELDSSPAPGFRFAQPLPSHNTSLGELITLLMSFRSHRETLLLPDYSNPFVRALYATYLTFLKAETYGYALAIKADQRGSLAEFVKSASFGQIFVSRTKPGITRGDHYHHTKCEKFMVVEGEGLVRLREIQGDTVIEFRCRGDQYRVVDIPPGHTHSIENVGAGEMVTLFWSSEVFDQARPDTLLEPVLRSSTEV